MRCSLVKTAPILLAPIRLQKQPRTCWPRSSLPAVAGLDVQASPHPGQRAPPTVKIHAVAAAAADDDDDAPAYASAWHLSSSPSYKQTHEAMSASPPACPPPPHTRTHSLSHDPPPTRPQALTAAAAAPHPGVAVGAAATAAVFAVGAPVLLRGLTLAGMANAFLLGTLVYGAFGAGGFSLVMLYFLFGTAVRAEDTFLLHVIQGAVDLTLPLGIFRSDTGGC